MTTAAIVRPAIAAIVMSVTDDDGQAIRSEHDARAAQNKDRNREIVKQVIYDERRNTIDERHALAQSATSLRLVAAP
jgi:hypothetical protein